MQRWFKLFLPLIALLSLAAVPASFETSIRFENVHAIYLFGDYALFEADFSGASQVKSAHLFVTSTGDGTQVFEVTPDNNGHLALRLDLTRTRLRPFSSIEYYWRLELEAGGDAESEPYSFDYFDNRFEWQQIGNERFNVHWITGDMAFGQAILDTADAGLDRALDILRGDIELPVTIYVYDDPTTLQESLDLIGITWVAGHASPDTGVVLVSIPPGPGQQLELERQIPHELMHILQYRLAGSAYERLPFWFIEGSASLAELYPNPDYERALDRARQQNTLISFESICTSRPEEASSAFLAYAQSESFVRFLHQNFGSIGLEALIEHYRNGLNCSAAVEAAFNIPLPKLEQRWQQDVLGMDRGQLALKELSPYLLLLGVVLSTPILLTLISLRRHKKEMG